MGADKTHRGHAIIEQVHADLKNSALARLPSGKFAANAAWLVSTDLEPVSHGIGYWAARRLNELRRVPETGGCRHASTW